MADWRSVYVDHDDPGNFDYEPSKGDAFDRMAALGQAINRIVDQDPTEFEQDMLDDMHMDEPDWDEEEETYYSKDLLPRVKHLTIRFPDSTYNSSQNDQNFLTFQAERQKLFIALRKFVAAKEIKSIRLEDQRDDRKVKSISGSPGLMRLKCRRFGPFSTVFDKHLGVKGVDGTAVS